MDIFSKPELLEKIPKFEFKINGKEEFKEKWEEDHHVKKLEPM